MNPIAIEAQSTRDRLFDEFETGLKNLANPLVAAKAMQKLGDIHKQITRGSVTDTAALWPSFSMVSETTTGSGMQNLLDKCADIAFGRSDDNYPEACLSPDIFAIYSNRQASQFVHFNNNVMKHHALTRSLEMSVDHGSFGALILTGRRASETQASVSYFTFARELAIANGDRIGRIVAEAHLIQTLIHDNGTKDDILAALRAVPSEKVMPYRRASKDYVTSFFICLNEVLAADTESREPKAECVDFIDGATILPKDVEDPAKTVVLTELEWSREGTELVAQREIETSNVAVTLLKFEDLSCPTRYWISQYRVPARQDGVGGRALSNTKIPNVEDVIQLEVGGSSQTFSHSDNFVTSGFLHQQVFAVNNDDEGFAYAALDHRRSIMRGDEGERVVLTISIAATGNNCSGKFGWLIDPTYSQISAATPLRLESQTEKIDSRTPGASGISLRDNEMYVSANGRFTDLAFGTEVHTIAGSCRVYRVDPNHLNYYRGNQENAFEFAVESRSKLGHPYILHEGQIRPGFWGSGVGQRGQDWVEAAYNALPSLYEDVVRDPSILELIPFEQGFQSESLYQHFVFLDGLFGKRKDCWAVLRLNKA